MGDSDNLLYLPNDALNEDRGTLFCGILLNPPLEIGGSMNLMEVDDGGGETL